MAQDTSLSGLRSQLVTSMFGRRNALAPGNSSDSGIEYLVGPKDIRTQVDGWNAVGTTITSTSVGTPIPAYGLTVVGATAASATTAYLLASPVPGVCKRIFNPTTGGVTVITLAGSFICSTGSVTSTFNQFSMLAKGAAVELWGLTTSLWGAVGFTQISTGGAGVTFV